MTSSALRTIAPSVRRIENVRAGDAARLSPLTYPSLAGLLAQGEDAGPLALATWEGEAPVALALGTLSESGEARLRSVFVEPAHRGRHVGRDLAAAWLRAARMRGATTVLADAARDSRAYPMLDRVLRAAGMPAATCLSIRVSGFAQAMADTGGSWNVARRVVSPDAVRYDVVSQLDEPARETFERFVMAANPALGSAVAEGWIDPSVSVAVRHDGEPVGWVLGRRIPAPLPEGEGATAVFYENSDIHPRFRRHGALVGAYWHAFMRQTELFGPRSIASYYAGTHRMRELSRRRFAPIALRFEEVMRFRLDVGSDEHQGR